MKRILFTFLLTFIAVARGERNTIFAELGYDLREKVTQPAIHFLKTTSSGHIVTLVQGREEICPQSEKLKEAFVDAAEQSLNCVTREFLEPLKEIDNELSSEIFDRRVATAIIRYCKASHKLMGCVDHLINAAKSCQSDGKETIGMPSYLLDHIRPVSEFICFNDGKRMIDITNDEEVVSCLKRIRKPLEDCVKEGPSVPTDIECEKQDSIRNCALQNLEKCETSSTFGISKEALDIILKGLRCNSASFLSSKVLSVATPLLLYILNKL